MTKSLSIPEELDRDNRERQSTEKGNIQIHDIKRVTDTSDFYRVEERKLLEELRIEGL